jgi:nucleoside-diphosphate-sugar epimerase
MDSNVHQFPGLAVVTGGAGCLGTPLVRRLAGEGHAVSVLSRSADGAAHLRDTPGVSVVQGSLEDGEALERACDGAEVVYHLAAKVHSVPRDHTEEREFFHINTDGTARLLAAAKSAGARRLVMYSTVAVYGETAGFDADETTPTNPATPYGRSKLEAERLVLGQSEVEGVVLRLPVAYGPKDRGNISRLIRTVARRRFFWVGHGENRRSLVGAGNAAAAAVLAGKHPAATGETFLVTDGPAASLAELVAAIGAGLGQSWTPPNLPSALAAALAVCGSGMSRITGRSMPFDRDAYAKLFSSLVFSSDKLEGCLGFRAPHSLQEGIAGEVAWLRTQNAL